MTTKVCIAGATGWAGSALTAALHQAEDMTHVGAVSRKRRGNAIGDILGLSGCDVIVSGQEAFNPGQSQHEQFLVAGVVQWKAD